MFTSTFPSFFSDSGVREVAFPLKRPSYSYGDSSGIKPDSLLIPIHLIEPETNFAAKVGGNNLNKKSLEIYPVRINQNIGLTKGYLREKLDYLSNLIPTPT